MRAQNRNLLMLGTLLVLAFAWILYSVSSEGGAPMSEPAAASENQSPFPDPGKPSGLDRTSIAGNADAVQVQGRVVDAYGEPIANALVGAVVSDRPAVTSPDGRFDLYLERGDTPTTLLVLAAGHAPFLLEQGIPPDAEIHQVGDIHLLPGGGIRGQITDPSGQAVQGAMAALIPAGSFLPPSLGELLKPVSPDAGGFYSFAHLMPGTYRVTASAPGMQSIRSGSTTVTEAGVTTVDPIVLQVGYDLTGVVLGPGNTPLAGALVRVRNGSNQPRYDGQMETTEDGRFQMDATPPGPLRVEVTRPGFLGYSRSDVDARGEEELIVRLEAGLRVTGTVVDARSGEPVEAFAAVIRRVGRVAPPSLGSMEQQLRRQIDSLRVSAAGAPDPEARAQLKIAAEFESRLERVRQQGQSRPVAVPADVGPVVERPGGRFSFDGLEEGLYAVGVSSPEHAFAEVGPVEVGRSTPSVELRIGVVVGQRLSGVVVARRDGAPIEGAEVELVRVLEASADVRERSRSLYPWAFARGGPQGVTLRTTTTDGSGSFEFPQASPGRSLLVVRHPDTADHETDPFFLRAGPQTLRIAVGARASLTGRIGNIPPGQEDNVEVVALGGHGTTRTRKARPDGTYRFDGLQPGDYIVRAFPADETRYVSRLFGSIFPLHAGAVDPDKVPSPDVTLAEGDTQVLDLMLDLPPTGIVEGTVTINGQPTTRGRATLRPVPGEAPGSGGLSLRGDYDEFGRFAIRDVPAGEYTLALSSATNQEIHQEPITVAPGATTTVQPSLVAGGLRGRITAPGANPGEITGYVWVLPGASQAPADLYAYRRENRTHRIRVQGGAFEDGGLTPGPAVVVVDVRGREQAVTETVIPAGETRELALTVAGGRR